MTDPKPGVWDPDMKVEAPMLRRLHALWQGKRRGTLLPARADFDPLEMKDCLGGVFLVETLTDEDDFRYTLIGSDITRTVQIDNTGKRVSEVFGGSGLALYRRLRDEARPIRVHGPLDWRDKEYIDYEAVILPLADDGKRVDRFIGGMVFHMANR